jgi:tRNA-Thr(GGU) m(6)t(6)A37 methyltransferase TsaA
MDIIYHPIGILHTPFRRLRDMPIQPTGAASAPGTADIFAEFADGLKDVDGFSHVILLYHLHRARQARLRVIPFLDSEERGIFATRAPSRPNPIGLSIVRLLRVQGRTLYLENIDILDGTPLLDLKPYVPAFDQPTQACTGWLEHTQGKVSGVVSDDRFA